MPSLSVNGDWIDLFVPEYIDCVYERGKSGIIDLGIAMQLPRGYEALVVPRSSTFKHFGITLVNSVGVIDNSYCGGDDTWKFGYLAFKNGMITPGARICQFKVQLSQKATIWQKIKWLFDNKIKFKEVEFLGGENRNGIGSTGI